MYIASHVYNGMDMTRALTRVRIGTTDESLIYV